MSDLVEVLEVWDPAGRHYLRFPNGVEVDVPVAPVVAAGDYIYCPSDENRAHARLARRTLYGGRKGRRARRRLYALGYSEAHIWMMAKTTA